MFDQAAREIKDYLLAPSARMLTFVTPSQISLLGVFVAGILFFALMQHHYALALGLWVLNRLLDGIDGVVAREHAKQSDFGGYVDIICDYIAYTLVPIGIVLGMPTQPNWIALVFLLATFYVNSASWMYLAALLEKRNLGAAARGESTSITMPVGVVAGVETIIFFTLFIMFPQYVVYLFSVMGALVIVGIIQRLVWARQNLIDS